MKTKMSQFSSCFMTELEDQRTQYNYCWFVWANTFTLIMNFKTCDTCFMGNLSLIDVHVSIFVRSRGQRARAGGRGDGRDIWPESGCQ